METIMKTSYTIHLDKQKKRIASVGKTRVTIFERSTLQILLEIKGLKCPSETCFSPSGRKIAVKNTSGKIKVFDLETQDCISSQISRKVGEGNRMYFVDENRIISCDWDGNLFLYHILSQKTEILAKFSQFGSACNLVSTSNNLNFILLGHAPVQISEGIYDDFIEIYKICVDSEVIATLLLREEGEIEASHFTCFEEKTFFYSDFKKEIFCYHLDMNILESVHGISENKQLIDIGYFTDICMSENGDKIALSFNGHVRVYDSRTYEMLNLFRLEYISNVHFLNNETLWIGSWKKIVLVKV